MSSSVNKFEGGDQGKQAVLRIRDMLIGSGSLDPYSGLRIRIWLQIRKGLFISVAFKMPTKIMFF